MVLPQTEEKIEYSCRENEKKRLPHISVADVFDIIRGLEEGLLSG